MADILPKVNVAPAGAINSSLCPRQMRISLNKILLRFLIFFTWSALTLVVLVFLTNIFIYVVSLSYIYKNVENVPEAQTGLVLGASVLSSGALSRVFKDRVDTAIELYKTKKVTKILASGDNSTVTYNEVNPAREYLLEKDIPYSDIFLDHAGFDTYSTMYRAREIFKVSSVIIVTQSFHLPRAVFIARALGIDAYGLSADSKRSHLKNYIREVFANEKAILDLIFFRQPKFLGEVIPII